MTDAEKKAIQTVILYGLPFGEMPEDKAKELVKAITTLGEAAFVCCGDRRSKTGETYRAYSVAVNLNLPR